MKKNAGLLLLVTILLVSCKNNADQKDHYFDKSGMDTAVSPGDNFFLYANGGWIKNAKIPDDQSGWGGFFTLYNDNLKQLRTILEETSVKTDHPKGSAAQKVGDFYASGMDTVILEKKGFEPIKPMLASIEAVTDYKGLMKLIAESSDAGEIDELLGFYVGPDEKNSAKNILVFVQTGLTLPEKDYYTKTDAITTGQRNKLVAHAAKYFELSGMDAAAASKSAANVLAIETVIAKSHLTPVEQRDPVKNYNKMSVSELEQIAPNIGWASTLSRLGIKADSVNVSQPAYYKALSELLASQPIQVWKDKFRFDYISEKSGYLNKAFRDERFAFNSIFSGIKVQPERWKSMVQRTDNGLKDLLGQVYVEKYFPPAAKQRMDELVTNLQKAFSARIAKLDWMSDTTKQRAQEKLNAIIKKIGYPEKWKNYDDVDISRDNLFGNIIGIARHDNKAAIAKIGKPVDRTEWEMTAPTVNAYYNPTINEIVFPAGILQFPFFHLSADDAINYGAIGMVIGHEITHGFDDQGRQYDARGNMKDWWTKTDGDKFTAKAKGVIAQYNGFVVLDSLHINGELTLGENLADIGGLAIAWDAFKLTKQGQSADKTDDLTPDQRFFLGFAQVWRMVNRPENVRTGITTDPHSPEEFRVNAPLSNFDPFYTTYKLTPKSRLWRKQEDRVKIW